MQQCRYAKMVAIGVVEQSTVINHAETWTPGVCRQEQIRQMLGSPTQKDSRISLGGVWLEKWKAQQKNQKCISTGG